MSIADCLRYWALTTNQSQNSVRLILNILRAKTNCILPKSTKTLLETPRSRPSSITEINGGLYWYDGIDKNISNYFRHTYPPYQCLSLNICIDGLPLYKSSSVQFWPNMANIHEMSEVPPMTVAIFCGMSKPGDLESYLRPFIEELNIIKQYGIIIKSRTFSINLRAIIADSPARSFIKISPLLDLQHFNMIDVTITSDPLHLIDVGVTWKLILGWRDLTMFSSEKYRQNWHLAAKVLEDFVDEFGKIYDEKYLTSNVHNLLHVYDDVENYGVLGTTSSYPFENHLQFLKKIVRGGSKQLEQPINRLIELQQVNIRWKHKTEPFLNNF
ncbi:uncharacterized protein LOC128729051 [Anopheles nili]|uniref:uncharacterized protein LOC128729051 n=1 Tax=Anopheles nili TaxID=185578 RepID=UPI00237A28F0|nr:uncharacterized protein LOC128729051 [Anopheles nili]